MRRATTLAVGAALLAGLSLLAPATVQAKGLRMTLEATGEQLLHAAQEAAGINGGVDAVEEIEYKLGDESSSMFGPPDGAANLTNWGENWCGHGLTVHHPKTYEEVAGLVRALSAQGAKVRVLGVMHSWSNVFADDGSHVIFLDNFKSIIQDPNDYTVVTLQAGVTNAELADWADSPNRGYGRFSYLPGNTLVQAVTYIGAAQTASHVRSSCIVGVGGWIDGSQQGMSVFSNNDPRPHSSEKRCHRARGTWAPAQTSSRA